MSIAQENIIGEVVAKDYRTASIFNKYKIDFCCNGKRTIEQACKEDSQISSRLLEELNTLSEQKSDANIDFSSWPADLLIDYILKIHHRYVVDKSNEIKPFLDKVCRVHGQNHPELFKIREMFLDSLDALTLHMHKEEVILFPYIQAQVKATQNGEHITAPFGTVENPIAMMHHEHDIEGNRFRAIRQLTNEYVAPSDGCTTYKVLFAMLEEFEQDLHRHIHLENNILFPMAIKMEAHQGLGARG
ncbi:MAG: iron-sulfur cluster repair di-iron protein [Saprospiraceae bacterium]|nr:iron-sulfur cluster repair di-iron protein [Saprospiraceae bacterium]